MSYFNHSYKDVNKIITITYAMNKDHTLIIGGHHSWYISSKIVNKRQRIADY